MIENRPVHRVVLKIEADYLDTTNVVEIDEGYEKYLSMIEQPSLLPIDFGRITYISTVYGILIYSLNKDFHHQLLLMNLDPNVLEVLEWMEFFKLPQFKVIPNSICPICGSNFNTKKLYCRTCGQFDIFVTPLNEKNNT